MSWPTWRIGWIALLVVSISVTSCGFRLRGQVDLPEGINTLHLRTPDRLLTEELTLLLEAGGASLVGDAGEADAILDVGPESFSERILSINPETGKASEFQLGYVVIFSFKPNTGPAIVDGERVQLVRDLLFDDEAVIGKQEERSTLYAEMRRDAAQQILLRLRARMTP